MEQTEQRIAGLTKAEFTELNAQHAGRLKIASVTLPSGEDFDAILRPMSRLEYDKFQQDLIKARQRGDSLLVPQANAVRASLLAPSRDHYDAEIERTPALIEHLAEQLTLLAGADLQVREKAFL